MKYAFMTFSTPELSLVEALAVARRYGYDGIEPRLDDKHRHGVEVSASPGERQKIVAATQRYGVALACLATSCRYADPAALDAAVQETHERIDLAGDVGCPRLRVFGGPFPDDPGAPGRERAVANLVSGLSAVADHAGERGVTLCLETHDAWCDPRHVAEVLGRVDHPAVGANWDVMHPVRAKLATIDESFEILKPWIRHLHVHDADLSEGRHDRLLPIGSGDLDHRRVIELLAGIEYDGFLSGEWIDWEPFEEHLPRELAAMRHYEDL